MLDPILGGSLISAGAGLLGNVLNVGSTIQTNEAQKELARYQFDLERQLIKEQNDYNSQVKQMARYQEAGLNPNLIYGNGSSSSGNQNTIARYNAPNLEAPSYDLSSIGNLVQTALSLQTAKSLSYKALYDAENSREDARRKAAENRVYGVLTGFYPDMEQDKFFRSPYFSKYSAELSSIELGNTLKKSSETLNQLTAAEKRYYNNFIQPLIMSGHTLSNNLLRKEINTFMLRFGVDAGTKLVGALNPLTRFIKSF